MSFLRASGYYGVIPIVLYLLYTYPESYIITTKTGDVKGQKIIVGSTAVYAYLGIPYAAPPIGELRFKEPKPVEPWEKVFDATKLPPSCWQPMGPPMGEWNKFESFDFDEDCLRLNIWVPYQDNTKKAVMVWIHGGGFIGGSAVLDLYDGKNLAAQGNVIVVTLNYRLGAFGFLYSGTEDAPGNMGLKDQLLALRWIKDNIEAFGGDPSQITLFGESAGSFSVNLHVVSPLTKGLFERAILQSGSLYQPTLLHNTSLGIAFSDKFASILSCSSGGITMPVNPTEVVNCLKKLPPSEIATAKVKIIEGLPLSLQPIYGDDYLPKNLIEEVNAGNVHDVPIFIGSVADEGSLLLEIIDPLLAKIEWPVITRDQAAKYIETIFQWSNNPTPKVIIDYYLGNVSSKDSRLLLKRTYDAIGDFLIYCPSVFLSEAFSTNGLKVYHYIFNQRRTVGPTREWQMVSHLEDVPFVFGTHFSPDPHLNALDIEFSKRVMEAWTSFAKTGKPRSEPFGIEEWPLYKKENPTAIELKAFKSKVINPYIPACHFWRQYV